MRLRPIGGTTTCRVIWLTKAGNAADVVGVQDVGVLVGDQLELPIVVVAESARGRRAQ